LRRGTAHIAARGGVCHPSRRVDELPISILMTHTRARTDTFPARFSADEFLAMVEGGAFDGMSVELLIGELHRMTPPSSEHGRLQLDVGAALRFILRDTKLMVFAEVGIRLSDDTVVAADVAVARPRDAANRILDAAEIVLAVEISVSKLRPDLEIKRFAYARSGVPNYWVVDATRRLVHRFASPIDGDYLALGSLRFGEAVPVPGTEDHLRLD